MLLLAVGAIIPRTRSSSLASSAVVAAFQGKSFGGLFVSTTRATTRGIPTTRTMQRQRQQQRWMTSSTTSNTTNASKMTPADEAMLGRVRLSLDTAIQHHGASNVVFLDGSWWLGNRETTSRQDFERGPRIAGAHFFDIDDIATPPGSAGNPKSLPHMMPTASTFARAMDAMGISNSDHIVVYGQQGCPYLHRAWFQIYCMGHELDRVHVLEGSLQDWIDAEGPLDKDATTTFLAVDLDASSQPTRYQAIEARNVVDMQEMRRLAQRSNRRRRRRRNYPCGGRSCPGSVLRSSGRAATRIATRTRAKIQESLLPGPFG